MGSPIVSWEGVAAYFNGADSGAFLALWLVISLALTMAAIALTARHESATYKRIGGK
jgi:hypothetical protein